MSEEILPRFSGLSAAAGEPRMSHCSRHASQVPIFEFHCGWHAVFFWAAMELKKDALRVLKKEISKGKDNASKLSLLRETLLNQYPDATLFIIRGWDTFEASWDPESSPWYVYRAYFSKGRSLQEMKRLQAEEYNPIADRYYLVQGTVQELTEGKLKGQKFSPWEVETILVYLFSELKQIS